jgi:antitoxin component of MazEF toxin-antitoxin module
MFKKVIRSGNSLALTIPSKFVKEIGIKKGDKVEVVFNKPQNQIRYKFFGNTQLSLINKK